MTIISEYSNGHGETAQLMTLERYGTRGWEWAIRYEDGLTVHNRTNGNGQGLWEVGDREDRQVLGTIQYWIGESRGAAIRKLTGATRPHAEFTRRNDRRARRARKAAR